VRVCRSRAGAAPAAGRRGGLARARAALLSSHGDEKYRKAYDVVADDSKDAFLTSNKPHYDGFEIQKIVFSDNFTKAVVTTQIHTTLMFFGISAPEKAVEDSSWKMVDGQWYWYVAAQTTEESKFTPAQRVMMDRLHIIPPGTKPPAATPGTAPFALPPGALPPGMAAGGDPAMPSLGGKAAGSDLLKQLRSQVRLDRNSVELRADQPGTATVVVKSASNGPVRVAVSGGGIPGLTVTLDKAEIPALGSATITIAWKPGELAKAPPSSAFRLSVLPSGMTLPFTVRLR
jgi:hypothetical protein